MRGVFPNAQCPRCGTNTAHYLIKECENCRRYGCACIMVQSYVFLKNNWVPFKISRKRVKRYKNVKFNDLPRKKLCKHCYQAWQTFGSLDAGVAEYEDSEGGKIWNLLFVCKENMERSPTAKELFQNIAGIQVDSAGTSTNARVLITKDMIDWADIIFVMEEKNKQAIVQIDPLAERKIVVLDIPDRFRRNQSELIELLEDRVRPYIDWMQS